MKSTSTCNLQDAHLGTFFGDRGVGSIALSSIRYKVMGKLLLTYAIFSDFPTFCGFSKKKKLYLDCERLKATH